MRAMCLSIARRFLPHLREREFHHKSFPVILKLGHVLFAQYCLKGEVAGWIVFRGRPRKVILPEGTSFSFSHTGSISPHSAQPHSRQDPPRTVHFPAYYPNSAHETLRDGLRQTLSGARATLKPVEQTQTSCPRQKRLKSIENSDVQSWG